MKNRITFSVVVVVLFAVYVVTLGLGQTIEATDVGVHSNGNKVFYQNRPFTGTLMERNLQHDPWIKTHYKNGEKNGVSLTYHHNGNVIARNFFQQGKKEGRQEGWYADGKIRSVSFFSKGVAEGILTEWHPNGKIYRMQTIKDGIETQNKMFYESGVIYSNYVVRDSRTFGIQGEPLCSTTKQEGFK